jgi:nucleotide-binding universal stress UspA family protein
MAALVQKIVVPVDFSEASERATTYAWTLARQLGASIYLIHVLETGELAQPPVAFDPDSDAARDEALYQDARTRLAEIAERLGPGAHPLTLEVRRGETIESITQAVVHYGADLIIMATHGRTGLSHLLAGSVAEGVIRAASCPVLVIRASGQVQVHRRPDGAVKVA